MIKGKELSDWYAICNNCNRRIKLSVKLIVNNKINKIFYDEIMSELNSIGWYFNKNTELVKCNNCRNE